MEYFFQCIYEILQSDLIIFMCATLCCTALFVRTWSYVLANVIIFREWIMSIHSLHIIAFFHSPVTVRWWEFTRKKSSVIRQKSESQKRVLQEKKARQIFRKINISYPLIHMAYQGVRNVRWRIRG